MEKSQGFHTVITGFFLVLIQGFRGKRFQGKKVSGENIPSIKNTIKNPLKTLLTFRIKGVWNFHSKIRSIKNP